MVRTRFAPSPTGFLHVGGARTALFSWLYARHHNGVFILRIEDTDLERSTEASIDAILKGMEWLDLDYDEGPYYQTQRFDRYREVLQQLLAENKAYKCYCSKERLEALRTEQQAKKLKPRYDGFCREHPPKNTHDPYVIRFRNPLEGVVTFTDKIRGTISVNNAELDDLVLARSDGVPTYNFSVVVDDWDMQITDVIRGDDHINNTPRQINIFKALGVKEPNYAHVPMILGSDGKRLSKRHGAVSVLQYREEGILPEALINYLVRLGWAHGDQEIFSREEMTKLFDIQAVSRSPATFNPDKLLWLNQHYMKNLSPLIVIPALENQLNRQHIPNSSAINLAKLIEVQAERTKTLVEMANRSRYFFEDFAEYDAKAAEKNLRPEIVEALQAVSTALTYLSDWKTEDIHNVIIEVSEKLGLNLGKLAQPIRVAVTGGTVSPPIDATLFLIGKPRVLQRLEQAIQYARNHT